LAYSDTSSGQKPAARCASDTIRNYREPVRQCEQQGEYATAEHIHHILVNEQDHQIELATALGQAVPDASSGDLKRSKA
jgi:hypothetical protein